MNQVEEVRNRLCALCEPGFQKFSAALIPGEERMLGVRLPALRALAKKSSQTARTGKPTSPPRPGSILRKSCLGA